jgi:antitoxin VapB
MNAPTKMSRKGKLFKSNRSQAVRIPKDLAFAENIKDIIIRRSGDAIIITPAENFWDDFFDRGPNPDFPERFPQGEYEVREEF